MFEEMKNQELENLDGGFYAWSVVAGIAGVMAVANTLYEGGKNIGEALYYLSN